MVDLNWDNYIYKSRVVKLSLHVVGFAKRQSYGTAVDLFIFSLSLILI